MDSGHPALAGLDDVAWNTVEHAYGPATDVPDLLIALTRTREQQEQALWELHGNIWHQGTIYEATAHAVPFLARLVLAEPPPLRDELLDLLASIATGTSYLDVHRHFTDGELSDEEQAAMEVQLAHVEAARAAVLDAMPRIIEKLRGERTPGSFALVARLAAAYPDDPETFNRPLQWMWEHSEDIRVRAALGIAFARRGDERADAILTDLFADLHANPDVMTD